MEPYSAAVLAALEVIRCDREKQKRLIQGLVARDLCDIEDAAQQVHLADECAARARQEVFRGWAAEVASRSACAAVLAATVQAAPVRVLLDTDRHVQPTLKPRRKHRKVDGDNRPAPTVKMMSLHKWFSPVTLPEDLELDSQSDVSANGPHMLCYTNSTSARASSML